MPDLAIPFDSQLRTRGYELDNTHTVPLPVILSYLEHVRWEVMQQPSIGILDLLHAGYFFVVHTQTVELLQQVGVCVDLKIQCAFETVGRSTVAVRHQVIRKDDSTLVAHARVAGPLLNPKRQLARLPDELLQAAQAQQNAILEFDTNFANLHAGVSTGETQPPKPFFEPSPRYYRGMGLDVCPPKSAPEDTSQYSFTVRPSDHDILSHVNATHYVRFFNNALLLGAQNNAYGDDSKIAKRPLTRVAIKYHQESVAQDQLAVHSWRISDTPSGFGCLLYRNGQTQPLCRARLDTEDPQMVL